jgi:hypothetical protein
MATSIRPGVTVRLPLVMIDISKSGVLTRFEMGSPPFLGLEVADQLPTEVFKGTTVEIAVEFRAVHVFNDFPVLRIAIDDKAKG